MGAYYSANPALAAAAGHALGVRAAMSGAPASLTEPTHADGGSEFFALRADGHIAICKTSPARTPAAWWPLRERLREAIGWLRAHPACTVRAELSHVHVEQQRRGRDGAAHTDGRSAEREARELGPAIASGQRGTVLAAAPRMMQRDGPDSEAGAGAGRAPAAGPQLQLDLEVERLMLQHYIRWWLGSALLHGKAPGSAHR